MDIEEDAFKKKKKLNLKITTSHKIIQNIYVVITFILLHLIRYNEYTIFIIHIKKHTLSTLK